MFPRALGAGTSRDAGLLPRRAILRVFAAAAAVLGCLLLARMLWFLVLAAAAAASAAASEALTSPHAPVPTLGHVLVIDSGSSGTRMFAYTWQQHAGQALPHIRVIPANAAPDKIPVKEKQGLYNRVETQPGIDVFWDDPASLQLRALTPLLDWAKAVVPREAWPSTPLFLMATAGVRRLPEARRAALLESVRQLLGSSGFRFEAPWARNITGAEEGAYGWVAMNYERGTLRRQSLGHMQKTAGAALHGAAPHATAPDGGVLHGAALHGAASHGAAAHGVASHGVATDGGVLHEAVSHGAASHGAALHGVASHGVATDAGVLHGAHDLGGDKVAKGHGQTAATGAAVHSEGGEAGEKQQGRRLGDLGDSQAQPRGTAGADEATGIGGDGGVSNGDGGGAGGGSGPAQGHTKALLEFEEGGSVVQQQHLLLHKGDATLGVLDLGGSSLEVTMSGVERLSLQDGKVGQYGSEERSPVVLPGVRYELQTYTLRHFGLNDAFDRSITFLLQEASKRGAKPPAPPPPALTTAAASPAADPATAQVPSAAGKAGQGEASAPSPPSSTKTGAVGGEARRPAGTGAGSNGGAIRGGGTERFRGGGHGSRASGSDPDAPSQGGAGAAASAGKQGLPAGKGPVQPLPPSLTSIVLPGSSHRTPSVAADRTSHDTPSSSSSSSSASSTASSSSAAKSSTPMAGDSHNKPKQSDAKDEAPPGRQAGAIGGGGGQQSHARGQETTVEKSALDGGIGRALLLEGMGQAGDGAGGERTARSGGEREGGPGGQVAEAAGARRLAEEGAAHEALGGRGAATGGAAATGLGQASSQAVQRGAHAAIADGSSGSADGAGSSSSGSGARGSGAGRGAGVPGSGQHGLGGAGGTQGAPAGGRSDGAPRHAGDGREAARKAAVTAAGEAAAGASGGGAGDAKGHQGAGVASDGDHNPQRPHIQVVQGAAMQPGSQGGGSSGPPPSPEVKGGAEASPHPPAATLAVSGSSQPPMRGMRVLEHPCMHVGYSAPYARVHTFGVEPGTSSVLLKGAHDWQACKQLAQAVAHSVAPCNETASEACSSDVPRLPTGRRFLAMSGFFVVWRFLSLEPEQAPGEVLRHGADFCARSWAGVRSSPLSEQANLERYCLWGPYVVALLQSLGLEQGQMEVGSGDVSWTLGATLVEGSKLAHGATLADARGETGGGRDPHVTEAEAAAAKAMDEAHAAAAGGMLAARAAGRHHSLSEGRAHAPERRWWHWSLWQGSDAEARVGGRAPRTSSGSALEAAMWLLVIITALLLAVGAAASLCHAIDWQAVREVWGTAQWPLDSTNSQVVGAGRRRQPAKGLLPLFRQRGSRLPYGSGARLE